MHVGHLKVNVSRYLLHLYFSLVLTSLLSCWDSCEWCGKTFLLQGAVLICPNVTRALCSIFRTLRKFESSTAARIFPLTNSQQYNQIFRLPSDSLKILIFARMPNLSSHVLCIQPSCRDARPHLLSSWFSLFLPDSVFSLEDDAQPGKVLQASH